MKYSSMLPTLALVAVASAGCATSPPGGSSPGVPSTAEQACLRGVTDVTNNPDAVLLGSEPYQGGGRYVRVGVGPNRAAWQCIGYPDGRTAEIMSLTDEGRY